VAEPSEQWSAEREQEWRQDCLRWRDKVLTGRFRHWCFEWDGLPVDETTQEWPCGCFEQEAKEVNHGR